MGEIKPERGNRLLRFFDSYLGVPLMACACLYRRMAGGPGTSALRPRIGVICLGAIGDLLLLSPLLNGIRDKSPNAHLQIITSQANAYAIPLLKNIDAHFSAPITHCRELLAHTRRQNFDLLIDAGQWPKISALLCAFSGTALTVGFNTPGQMRHMAFDIAAPHSASRHEIDNFLALGRVVWPDLEGKPGLALPPWRRQNNTVYCHMFPAPGAGRELKQWPEIHWAELIKKLLAQGYDICLTGSESDAAVCADFINRNFSGMERVRAIAGQITLADLGVAFTKAAAIVSVNTGIMHLGALSGAPTIGLNGATNPLRWGAAGECSLNLLPRQGPCAYLNLGFEYPANATPAMVHLPVEDVLESLAKLEVGV